MLSILQVILLSGHVSPGVRCVTLTVGRSAASSQPPFGPTLTSAAPTPLPGISSSLCRNGNAHPMLVLMLRCAESAHSFFSFKKYSFKCVLFHIAVTQWCPCNERRGKKNQFFRADIILLWSPSKSCCAYKQLCPIFVSSKLLIWFILVSSLLLLRRPLTHVSVMPAGRPSAVLLRRCLKSRSLQECSTTQPKNRIPGFLFEQPNFFGRQRRRPAGCTTLHVVSLTLPGSQLGRVHL